MRRLPSSRSSTGEGETQSPARARPPHRRRSTPAPAALRSRRTSAPGTRRRQLSSRSRRSRRQLGCLGDVDLSRHGRKGTPTPTRALLSKLSLDCFKGRASALAGPLWASVTWAAGLSRLRLVFLCVSLSWPGAIISKIPSREGEQGRESGRVDDSRESTTGGPAVERPDEREPGTGPSHNLRDLATRGMRGARAPI